MMQSKSELNLRDAQMTSTLNSLKKAPNQEEIKELGKVTPISRNNNSGNTQEKVRHQKTQLVKKKSMKVVSEQRVFNHSRTMTNTSKAIFANVTSTSSPIETKSRITKIKKGNSMTKKES